MVKTEKYVNSGEVRSGGSDTILNSGAIGSCVVITAHNPLKKIGAMAHVLLPGNAPFNNHLQTTRYAFNAIEELLSQLKSFDVYPKNIEVCIIGGANVLKREADTIGNDNLNSVENLLREKQIEIKVRAVGGFERRTVLFEIEKGEINYTEGDSKQLLLWKSSVTEK